AYPAVLPGGAVLVFRRSAGGGLAFERIVLLPHASDAGPAIPAAATPRRIVRWAAAGLAGAWLLWLGLDSAVLVGTSDLAAGDVLGATYFRAGALGVLCAVVLAVLSRRRAGCAGPGS